MFLAGISNFHKIIKFFFQKKNLIIKNKRINVLELDLFSLIDWFDFKINIGVIGSLIPNFKDKIINLILKCKRKKV